jgi:glycosyltransferase involved in cell wall biosynthesis
VRICIHNQPHVPNLGGSEFCVAVLAEHLGKQHDIDILHEKEEMSLESLEKFYGRPLPRVRVLKVPLRAADQSAPKWAWQKHSQEKRHVAGWMEGYDLVVSFVHGPPPICMAPAGMMVVLFPLGEMPDNWPDARGNLRQRLRTRFHSWSWKQRMNSYQVKASISTFTRDWTRRRWGVDSGYLYPPCNTDFRDAPKRNVILSVGRFCEMKRQAEMMEAFASMHGHAPAGWQYRSVGPVGRNAETVGYFQKVQGIAAGGNAVALADLPRNDLTAEFEQASVFWHGAGYSKGAEFPPEQMEHFGITTVEAMAAGCVPVVINKGGQTELVEHGVSGYLWNTTDELKDFTIRLIQDDALRQRMSAAARIRARDFSKDSFARRFDALIGDRLRA